MAKLDYIKVQKKYGRKGLMSRLFLIILCCMAECKGDRNKKISNRIIYPVEVYKRICVCETPTCQT